MMVPFVLLLLAFNNAFCHLKVSYIGGNIGFEFVGSSFTEVVINKSYIDTSKRVVEVVFGTMTIKNIGSTTFDVSLAISTMTSKVHIVTSEPVRYNQYRFFAMFTTSMPSYDEFSNNDLLLQTKKIADDKIFAKDTDSLASAKGYNINPAEERTIFFKMEVSTNVRESGVFAVNVTVVPSEYESVTVTPLGGEVEIFNRVKLEIPPGALKESKDIKIVKEPKGSLQKLNNIEPILAYRFYPKRLVFRKPAKLIFNYKYQTVADEDNLRVYLWDGYEWRYVGGDVNKTSKTVSTYISHFSVYALFPVVSVPTYKPKEKIITPALKDGINDVATFDGLSGKDVKVNIFDITGRKVKSIDVLTKGNIWDGTDEYGNVVESGVYIYQFEVDGKIYSGTITVAK